MARAKNKLKILSIDTNLFMEKIQKILFEYEQQIIKKKELFVEFNDLRDEVMDNYNIEILNKKQYLTFMDVIDRVETQVITPNNNNNEV